MPHQVVDRLRSLAHQEIARAEQHALALLFCRLDRDEPPPRECGSGAMRPRRWLCVGLRGPHGPAGCVRHVVLLTLDEGLHVDRRHELHRVAERCDLATPVMRAAAGLRRDNGRRPSRQEQQNSLQRQLLAECHRAVGGGAVQRQRALGERSMPIPPGPGGPGGIVADAEARGCVLLDATAAFGGALTHRLERRVPSSAARRCLLTRPLRGWNAALLRVARMPTPSAEPWST